MATYKSTRVMPYVYMCVHKDTNEFYIGSRTSRKQSTPSDIDFPQYKTSSAKVKHRFDEFNWFIVAEFFDRQDAYDFEQNLIFEHWGDPLCLNKFYTMGGKRMWGCDNLGRKHPNRKRSKGWKRKTPMTIEHKEKLSLAKKGKKLGPCPQKANVGESNGMYGKPHTSAAKSKMKATRLARTTEQNIQSYSRVKSPDEIAKLKARTIYTVCRIKDKKEMSIANYMKYLKLKPHLFE